MLIVYKVLSCYIIYFALVYSVARAGLWVEDRYKLNQTLTSVLIIAVAVGLNWFVLFFLICRK